MKTIERTISTEDGRKVRVLEAGQLDGTPALALHGTPGSRLLYDRWIEDAQARGIRLISYDRPGYGGSTPQRGRTVASAVEDVAAIAREFDLKRLLMWGVSGGGPHALACAALLPDVVVAAAALASPAPYASAGLDWMAGMGEDNVTEFGAALKGREALQTLVDVAAPGILGADPGTLVQAFRSVLCPADVAVITEEYAAFVLCKMREALKEGMDGWIDDDLAFTTAWGFELSQIRIPVMLVHGEQDRAVPFAHGKWLAGRIPGVEARLLPEDGHATVSVRRVPEVHAWLLSKM